MCKFKDLENLETGFQIYVYQNPIEGIEEKELDEIPCLFSLGTSIKIKRTMWLALGYTLLDLKEKHGGVYISIIANGGIYEDKM